MTVYTADVLRPKQQLGKSSIAPNPPASTLFKLVAEPVGLSSSFTSARGKTPCRWQALGFNPLVGMQTPPRRRQSQARIYTKVQPQAFTTGSSVQKYEFLQHRERQRREVLKDMRSTETRSQSPRKWRGGAARRAMTPSGASARAADSGEASSGIPG